MSGERGRRAAGALGMRWRLIAAVGLAGAALGFLWGVGDKPRYTAAATLLVEGPNGGQPDPAELARYAELGASERVAIAAAGLLGDDVAGADLLSDVAVEPGPDGVTLVVAATSELPDFAAATGDAFAEALIVITDEALRERLRSKRSKLDPDSEAAAALDRRIGELRSAGVGGPLAAGAVAQIPSSPSENRSAVLWGLGGLLVGLPLGALAALVAGRRGLSGDPREPETRAAPGPTSLLAAAFGGVPLLGRFNDVGSAVISIGSGEIHIDREAAARFRTIAEAIGLDASDAPNTLAFVDVSAREGADEIGTGVAIAAAESGLRVAIVEADLSAPSLADRHRVDGGLGLRDYLGGTATPREVVRRVRAVIGEGASVPLFCVPAGERIDGASTKVAGARFDGLIERLPRVFDLVVIEAPPLFEDDDAMVIAGSVEGVVLVARELESSRSGIEHSVAMLASGPLLGGVLVAGGRVTTDGP